MLVHHLFVPVPCESSACESVGIMIYEVTPTELEHWWKNEGLWFTSTNYCTVLGNRQPNIRYRTITISSILTGTVNVIHLQVVFPSTCISTHMAHEWVNVVVFVHVVSQPLAVCIQLATLLTLEGFLSSVRPTVAPQAAQSLGTVENICYVNSYAVSERRINQSTH